METPFVFGKIVSGEEFTDRKEEVELLTTNFLAGTNSILISPRRWGKSSLVNKAAKIAAQKDKKLIFCFLDLFNIRSEEEFYQLLAQEVLRATSGKMEEVLENAKKFLGQLIPKITFSPGDHSAISLGLDWKEVQKHPDEILDMPEKICASKKIRIVICMDEFQNIAEYTDPLAFQKKLRSHWQKHTLTSYCLYGSKRNMLMHVFSFQNMPFYKFGNILFLQKISADNLVKFIVKRFTDTGKVIDTKTAHQIAQLADCHPYYVQQLAQLAWFRSQPECSAVLVDEALDSLLMQLSLLFQNVTDGLTSPQVNFLKALIENVLQLSSKETLTDYKLGTSANIARIKKALTDKEIIDVQGSILTFLDPMYKKWLAKYFFKLDSSKG